MSPITSSTNTTINYKTNQQLKTNGNTSCVSQSLPSSYALSQWLLQWPCPPYSGSLSSYLWSGCQSSSAHIGYLDLVVSLGQQFLAHVPLVMRAVFQSAQMEAGWTWWCQVDWRKADLKIHSCLRIKRKGKVKLKALDHMTTALKQLDRTASHVLGVFSKVGCKLVTCVKPPVV